MQIIKITPIQTDWQLKCMICGSPAMFYAQKIIGQQGDGSPAHENIYLCKPCSNMSQEEIEERIKQ